MYTSLLIYLSFIAILIAQAKVVRREPDPLISIDLIDQKFNESLLVMSGPDGVCRTSGCANAASEVLKKIDKSVKPCDDFYRFACGKFLKDTHIPDDAVEVNSFSIIGQRVKEQLKRSIEESSSAREPRAFLLAKNLYKSCMNVEAIEAQGTKRLLSDLKKLGGWPVLEGSHWNGGNFDWIKTTYKLRALGYPINNFFDLTVTPDWKNNKRRVFVLDEAKTIYPGQDFLPDYYSYMVDIAVILGAKRDAAKEQLHHSLDFERHLAKLNQENEESGGSQYNLLTIVQLSKTYPNIPWVEYINHLLPPSIKVQETDVIIVKHPDYILKLENLMRATPKEVQANYLMWRTIESSVIYLNYEVRKRDLDWRALIEGKTEFEPRWMECLEVVQMKLPVSISALYVRKHFQKETKKNANEMVDSIKKQLYQILQKIDWMDDQTKKSALEKTASMASRIAYSDDLLDDRKLEEYYKGLTVSPDNYLQGILNIRLFEIDSSFGKLRKPFGRDDLSVYLDSTEANPAYHVNLNAIDIPAGILQNPAFGNDRPKYMNYGAVGSVMGHELTHGFDNEGRRFDKDGNMVNWWAPATATKYNAKVKCIIDQYESYTVKEVGLKLNGKNTQGENIADNGGFKLAYLAYKDWSTRNGQEPMLPGLSYTPRQMFWISTANFWCSTYRSEILKLDVETGAHSPAEFRVFGTLSNIPEFAEDFKCPLGSKMNPQKKCLVW